MEEITEFDLQKCYREEYGEIITAKTKPTKGHKEIQPSMITGSFIDSYLATGSLDRE